MQLQKTVTIKVIVTEDFKKYLQAELQNAIKKMDLQMQRMEEQGKKLVANLKKQGEEKTKKQISAIVQQLNMDKQQQSIARADLEKKIEEANNLKIDSEFVQGTVNGFVDVKEGDNLYQKIGKSELIIKDGIIQKIVEA
jgi:hypothetical protein